MANVDPQTLQEIQDAVNTLVANDADTPGTTDEEWDTRLNLIHTAIRNWGTTQDVFWNELWKTYTHPDLVSGVATYTLSTLTDLRFPGKKIHLTLSGQETDIPLISPGDADNYEDAGQKAAYITGNQNDGFTLRLTWTPVAGDGTYGATITFDYYKYPFKPTSAAHKVEMSDANYIVFWVAAQKSLLESQNNKYSVFDGQATEALDNMRIMNDLNGPVENTDALNGAVLGE